MNKSLFKDNMYKCEQYLNTRVLWPVLVYQYRVGFILLLYYNCIIFCSFFFKCIYVAVCLRNVNQYSRKKWLEHLGQYCTGFLPMQWFAQEY